MSGASSIGSAIEQVDPHGEAARWKGRHVLSTRELSKSDILLVLRLACLLRSRTEAGQVIDIAKGKVLANLFCEPSTRTSCSFQAAMLRLGGQVIVVNDVHTSSLAKGESLEDTARTLECYADVIAVRHPEVGSARRIANAVAIPVLNAGDGAGEHPTQALLDAFTIYSRMKRLENLKIVLLGDLKHGRTVHSILPALAQFPGNRFALVSPKALALDSGTIATALEIASKYQAYKHSGTETQTEEAKQKWIEIDTYESLEERSKQDASKSVLACADVLYVTRIQKERFDSLESYNAVSSSYSISKKMLEDLGAKPTLAIMHPLPRLQELSTDLDNDPRAAYFFQMRCGLFVRMALLCLTLGLDWKSLE